MEEFFIIYYDQKEKKFIWSLPYIDSHTKSRSFRLVWERGCGCVEILFIKI